MDIGRMRVEVTNTYPGKAWREKVRKMDDGQVTAIFYRFLNHQKNEKVDVAKQLCDFPPQVSFEDIFNASPIQTAAMLDANCIVIPYADQTMCGYVICPKEVLLAGWEQMIGRYFEISNRLRMVKGVRVDRELIFIDLD